MRKDDHITQSKLVRSNSWYRAWVETIRARLASHSTGEGTNGRTILHIRTRTALPAAWFRAAVVQEMLRAEVLHYARVCMIPVLHMFTTRHELHLIVELEPQSRSLSVMIGTLKAQLTRKLKRWANTHDRQLPTGRGSVWSGRYQSRQLVNVEDIARCVLTLRAATRPPRTPQPRPRSLFSSLWTRLRPRQRTPSQDAEETNHTPTPYERVSTGARDAQWVGDDEVLAQRSAPPSSWRRSYMRHRRGYIRPTPPDRAAPAQCPFWETLGAHDAERALLLDMLCDMFPREDDARG